MNRLLRHLAKKPRSSERLSLVPSECPGAPFRFYSVFLRVWRVTAIMVDGSELGSSGCEGCEVQCRVSLGRDRALHVPGIYTPIALRFLSMNQQRSKW